MKKNDAGTPNGCVGWKMFLKVKTPNSFTVHHYFSVLKFIPSLFILFKFFYLTDSRCDLADMDYCGVQPLESSESDLEIDIVNLSMSPKSTSLFVPPESNVNDDTAARVLPFAIACKKSRSPNSDCVAGPAGKHFIKSISVYH